MKQNRMVSKVIQRMTGYALSAMAAVACVEAAPVREKPVIFIGTAFEDRLAQLKDRSQWAVVAPRVGMFVHPNNINAGSPQLALMKEVAPLFGVRQVVIERNSLPTEEDIAMRIRLMRETFRFEDGAYFYFNGITAGKMVTKSGVMAPDSAWFARGRYAVEQGAVALYGPAPHVVYRPERGWQDPGWDFLRDLSVFKGYCFDAPAEMYVRVGKDDAARAANERYRKMVEDSIVHARKSGGKSIYLFGTHLTAEENIAHARNVVRDLKKRNALPWAWGIEDYTRNSKVPMTPECNPDGTPANTVTGLAYWIMGFYAGKFE